MSTALTPERIFNVLMKTKKGRSLKVCPNKLNKKETEVGEKSKAFLRQEDEGWKKSDVPRYRKSKKMSWGGKEKVFV